MEKSLVCNEELDYKERGKGSQIKSSLNLSHSEMSSQEEGFCLLDSIGENNDISAEAYKEGEVHEIVDISFENSHESSFQSYFEYQFDSMQEELLFGQPCHDKQVIEYLKKIHVFYDPVTEYMNFFSRWDGWLCICNK